MPKETVEISGAPPFLAAAQFTALVVYPDDVVARQRLARAESYRLFRECSRNGRPAPSLIPLEYLSITPKWADTLHKKAIRVFLQERMLAAELALAFICDAFVKERGGKGVELRADNESLGPLTIQNFGAWAQRRQRELANRADDPDKGYPKNFQQRAWKNTKRVLHLMTAYLLHVRGVEPENAVGALFGEPSRIADLFETAELCRERLLAIAAAGTFELREGETIRAFLGIKKISSE